MQLYIEASMMHRKTRLSMSHVRSTQPALSEARWHQHRTPLRFQLVTTAASGSRQSQQTKGFQIPPWCKSIIAAGAALAVTFQPALAADDLTITFKASRNPEIRKVQKSLVEAWGEPNDASTSSSLLNMFALQLCCQQLSKANRPVQVV